MSRAIEEKAYYLCKHIIGTLFHTIDESVLVAENDCWLVSASFFFAVLNAAFLEDDAQRALICSVHIRAVRKEQERRGRAKMTALRVHNYNANLPIVS
jgi:hypothetical protein